MEKLISCCGIVCSECEAYKATKNNDNGKLEELSEKWSTKEYRIVPEEILCDGCMTKEVRKFKFCSECGIRLCCREKGIENCSFCANYPCDKLNEIFKTSPENRKTLDEYR